MVEVAARHECSRPRELRMETAGQVVGHMETVYQAVGRTETVGQAAGRTVAAEPRMGCGEVGRTEIGADQLVVRKVMELVQGHHRVKELVRAAHRRAREPVQAVRMAKELARVARRRAREPVRVVRMAMGHCRAVAGKAIGWVEEDQQKAEQKEEVVEKVPLLLRNRSRMHLSCQSAPAGCCPLACRPLACRRP